MTALTRQGDNPIANLHQQYDQGRFNLLAPKIHVGHLPAGTQLAVREVRILPNETGMYKVDGNKVALGKTQLNKIASAAGITWVAVERTDDRHHPHYCEFTARARVTDFDGTVREAIGNKTVDLRDDCGDGTQGKDRASMSGKQLDMARKFLTEMCASKAMNRAIADILAIPRSFAPADLQKPFIVPKLVPDTSDAGVQQVVLANMLGSVNALYGAQAQAQARAQVVDATFDEPAQLPPAAGDAEGGAVAPAPSSADLPGFEDEDFDHDMDPVTGEVLSEEEIKARINKSWQKFKAAGGQPKAFTALIRQATGKNDYGDLTAADVPVMQSAVEAFIANGGGQ